MVKRLIRRIRARIERSIADLGDVVFPSVCAFCEADLSAVADGIRLCEACRDRLIEPETYRCPKCAARVAETFQDGDCPWCRDHGLRFDRTFAIGAYRGELREAVLRLKHSGFEALGAALAEALWSRTGSGLNGLQPDVVVPVPMHWWRRMRRGWNSPELTATLLAARLRIGDYPRLLVRRRNTRSQVGLSITERRENVRRAFRVRRGYRVRGANVLLVDDILTTGATASEAARALKEAGAKSVCVAVLGRAQGEV